MSTSTDSSSPVIDTGSPPQADAAGVSDAQTTASSSVPEPVAVAGRYATGDWQGCAWVAIDTVADSTVAPVDFAGHTAGEPFCVNGVVGDDIDYAGFALLGFNVAQTSSTCQGATLDSSATVVPTGDGLAITLAKANEFPLRVSLWGPNGSDDGTAGANDRWCVDIPIASGKLFVPYTAFDKQCWYTQVVNGVPVTAQVDTYPTVQPYHGEPISAVVFTIPGKSDADTEFELCVDGFAEGTSSGDAPDGPVARAYTGTLGPAYDSARAKARVGEAEYVIQNNVWDAAARVELDYDGSSFSIVSASGSGTSDPIAFPSIYVGANGGTMGGEYATSRTDHLPIAISDISQIAASFIWSGDSSGAAPTYEAWFSSVNPAGQRYNDALDATITIWFAEPVGKLPIGSLKGTQVIAGQTWDVWAGPHGSSLVSGEADLTPDTNGPVITFVAQATVHSLDFDLKDFIDSAVNVQGLAPSLWLTDVLGGFQVWSGGVGLNVDEFTVDVQ